VIVIGRGEKDWTIAGAARKLLARGALPGAFGYDLAAEALRRARRAGVPAIELLAPALPASWMVNARASSPVFQRWLGMRAPWSDLLAIAAGGPARWLARGAGEREAAAAAVRALAIEGQGVAAISKVLALLAPDTVPLMDDAAIAFALGGIEPPRTADDPRAGPEWFLPMLDWLARETLRAEPALAALARAYPLAPLEPAQVLDRLLWFESWGWRLLREGAREPWWWVNLGAREAIVLVDAPGPPALEGAARVDLAVLAGAWRAAAEEALAGG
jgi:hypothetical protein